MRIGFTGTQNGMTVAQLDAVEQRLIDLWEDGSEFHHGDCVGADAQAAELARALGYRLIGHPPLNPHKRAWVQSHTNVKMKPYLDRNHDIVDDCEHLIAAPGQQFEILCSGTWATVRYARKVGRPVSLIVPNPP